MLWDAGCDGVRAQIASAISRLAAAALLMYAEIGEYLRRSAKRLLGVNDPIDALRGDP